MALRNTGSMVFDYARFDHTTSSDVFEYRMAAAKSDVLPTQHHATWRRATLLMLLTFGLAALATSDIMHAALIDLLTASDVVIAGHPILGAVFFVAFAAVSPPCWRSYLLRSLCQRQSSSGASH